MNPNLNSQPYPGEEKVEPKHFLNPDQTGFFLWILDPEGLVFTVNNAVVQQLGYPAGDLIGKHPSDLEVFSESGLHDLFQNPNNHEFPYKTESRIKTREGNLLNVYLMEEKIDFLNGTYVLISAFGPLPVNMTINCGIIEGNSAQNEIRSYKDNIFSVIAHDLRSPFNTILGYCELLNSSIINSELNKSMMYTRIIKDATEQTLSFLVRLLDWGRLQNDPQPFNPVYFDADLPVKQIIRLCGFQADSKNIMLRTEIEAGLKVYGDVNMVRTIIVNLISNAIKFCNPGGKIIIKSFSVPGGAEFNIADNGIGIKTEDLLKLFSDEKLQSTNGTRMEHGTGLGLAICKSYVAIHHGRIWAESESGKGSIFKFVLPSQNLG
jgi:two-component system, sensor histidine kinase and response regulator